MDSVSMRLSKIVWQYLASHGLYDRGRLKSDDLIGPKPGFASNQGFALLGIGTAAIRFTLPVLLIPLRKPLTVCDFNTRP